MNVNAAIPGGAYAESEEHGNYAYSVCQRADIQYTVTAADVAAVAGGQNMFLFTLQWPIPWKVPFYSVMECLEIISIVGDTYDPFTYQISLGIVNKTTASVGVLLYMSSSAAAGDVVRLHCAGFSD
jgi:hypothetical protein